MQKIQKFEGSNHNYHPPRPLRPSSSSGGDGRTLRIVHISDTHDQYGHSIPAGDILVHTGDWSNNGCENGPEEVARFAAFLEAQPHRFKVVCCGNHEYGLDKYSNAQLHEMICGSGSGGRKQPLTNVFVLQDSEVVVRGLKFFGTAWTGCSSRQAWSSSSRDRQAKHWPKIPRDVDVLMTHMPPLNIFDLAWSTRHGLQEGEKCKVCGGEHPNYSHWGDGSLRDLSLNDLHPPLHLFGHVHDTTGMTDVAWSGGVTTFSNAAMDIKGNASVIDVIVPGAVPDATWPSARVRETGEWVNPTAAAAAEAAKAQSGGGASVAQTAPQQQQQQQQQQQLDPIAALVAGAVPFMLRPLAAKGGAVLDLDAQDPNHRTILLWRERKSQNQTWVLRSCSSGGGDGGYEVVNVFGGADRPLSYASAGNGGTAVVGCVQRQRGVSSRFAVRQAAASEGAEGQQPRGLIVSFFPLDASPPPGPIATLPYHPVFALSCGGDGQPALALTESHPTSTAIQFEAVLL